MDVFSQRPCYIPFLPSTPASPHHDLVDGPGYTFRACPRLPPLTNADNAPHVAFVDMAGHGYTVISAGPDTIDSEFVCIVRPIARATTPDGGPLRYRVSHQAKLWQPGARPKLQQTILEGDAKLSV